MKLFVKFVLLEFFQAKNRVVYRRKLTGRVTFRAPFLCMNSCMPITSDVF